MIKRIFFIYTFCLLNLALSGQDLQYSQYYNAPLFLNPAFAGTADNSRAVFDYRNQWPGLNRPYNTLSFSFDHRIEPINSGVGLIVTRDAQGAGKLNATQIGGIYSYMVPINKSWTFIPAIQVSWVNRSYGYQNLLFGDQIDPNNPSSTSASQDVFASNRKINYLDFTTGGVLFSDNFWFGVSLNHLNRPDQSFSNNKSDRLPLKSTVNVGYKFYFDDPNQPNYRERSIIPTLLYKTQGKFDQLDVGLYSIYDPIMIGFWYRGIPMKKYAPQYTNNDALIFLLGIHVAGLTVSYSYDLTISTLAKYSGGAHEIALVYKWKYPYRKKRRIMKRLPCPSFYGR